MKKYTIFITVLVLTLSMLTGCGCTRRKDEMETVPTQKETIMPTVPATVEPNVTDAILPTYDSMEPSGALDATETTGPVHETGTADMTEPAARNRTRPMQ